MIPTTSPGLILPLLLAFGVSGDETKGPSTGRVQTILWDFGVSAPDTEMRHRFSITNPSTTTWTVKFVTKSCACTVGEVSARRVKPSETTSLEVVYRASKTEGSINQAVIVEFQEENTPLFYLVIKGEVRNPLSALPARVEFGRRAPGAPARQTIVLRNFSGQDLTLTKVETPDWLRAEVQAADAKEEKPRPRQAWTLLVHADLDKLAAGPRSGALVVHANSKTIGPLSIPVTLHLNRPLEAIPGQLAFNAVAAGQSARKTVLLEVSPDLGPLTDKDLVVTHNLGNELEVEVTRTDSPHRFLVVGQWRSKHSSGKVEGEVEIKARGKTVPPVRIKVVAEVR